MSAVALGLALLLTAQTEPVAASKIILVGDSTTAVNSGWGGAFCHRHVTSDLACLNLAREGRSSSSYRDEGSWDIARSEMAAAGYRRTWVLIQFGHNDQPGKPHANALETAFPANLRRYVEETRASGANPVLVTPLTRRRFVDGELDNNLAAWAEAVRRVGTETDTPVIDLNAASARLVTAMGPLQAARLGASPAPVAGVADLLDGDAASTPPAAPFDRQAPFGRRATGFDYTHLGDLGADLFAGIVAEGLMEAAPDLRPDLIP